MGPEDKNALHRAIRQLAETMAAEGEMESGDFVRRFRADHPDLVTEYNDRLVNRQIFSLAKRRVKSG